MSTVHALLKLIRSYLFLLPVGLLAAVLAGCSSSSSLENMWKAPSMSSTPMRKMMVIGITKDQTSRRLWEDRFAYELSRHNVDATPSYKLFQDRLPDSSQAAQAVRANSDDGVLVVRALPSQTSTRFVPGYISTEPTTAYDPWTQMIYSYDMEIEHPGYQRTENVAREEVQVWSTNGKGQMVWSGVTNTIDPSSPKDIGNQIANVVVPELQKQGIIPQGK